MDSLPEPGVDLAARREGFLVGNVVGAALRATPALGRRHAAIALGDDLLAELTGGGVDLRRLAGRWVDWLAKDGTGADPVLLAALVHLRDYDAPPEALPGGSAAALTAALPAALASASPKAMIAGAFHVARMLDPAPDTALAAVSLVVASATFLEGRRDFIADVIAVLRANDASSRVVDIVRFIPRDPRAEPTLPIGASPDPIAVMEWTLWMAHHRSRAVDVLSDLARLDVSPLLTAIAAALFGARDTLRGWPPDWIELGGEEVILRQRLAARLGN